MLSACMCRTVRLSNILRLGALAVCKICGRLKPKVRHDSFCYLRVASVSSKSHGTDCPAAERNANAVSSANNEPALLNI